jgi:hypothetical protein
MSKNTRLILPVAFLILAMLACNTTTVVPSSSVDAVGTAAAQTVAAQLGSQPQNTAPAPATGVAPTTPPSVPTDTPVPSATPICDQAKFVSETVPDGSVFAPGVSFTKTWRLRNTGNCTWNSSYAVVFDSGDALGAPAAVPLSGSVAPGQEVDLPVNMAAPGAPGTYTGYWRMRNASGVLFGTTPGNSNFWVKITVVAPTATSSGLHIPIVPILPPLAIFPSVKQVYVSGTSIAAGGVGSATANCPSGSLVTSGGFAASNNMVVYTQLQSGNGWIVYAKNNDSVANPITVYAVCLSNESGSTSFQLASTSVGAGTYGQAVANCPAGSVVTGGGFASNAETLWVYNSSMTGNGWQVYARNLSGGSQGLNVYAICLSGSSATSTSIATNTTVSGGTYGSAEAVCPSGKLLTGGGYALGDNLSVYNSSMDVSDSTKWNVYANNSGGSGALMNVYAVCLAP